jgi:hypothetical protein
MCPVVQGVVAIGVGGASGEDAEVDDDAHDVNEALTGGHMQRRLHLLVEAVAALSPDLEEHAIGSPEQDGYWGGAGGALPSHHVATAGGALGRVGGAGRVERPR